MDDVREPIRPWQWMVGTAASLAGLVGSAIAGFRIHALIMESPAPGSPVMGVALPVASAVAGCGWLVLSGFPSENGRRAFSVALGAGAGVVAAAVAFVLVVLTLFDFFRLLRIC